MIAKVLLVDDEEPFVETLAKRLTKRELNVLTASSGPEALEKLEKDPRVEVVILDVKMPGMDGIEALKQIKTKLPAGGSNHADRPCHSGERDRRHEAGGLGLSDEALRHGNPDE